MSDPLAAAADALGCSRRVLEAAVELVPFVSPAHRATGNRVLQLDGAVVRVPSADTAALRDVAAGVRAARLAADAGVGPRVLWADEETGAIALERPAGFREARIEDLWGPVRARVADALLRFHEGNPIGRPVDLAARLDTLAGRLTEGDAPRPPDLDGLLAAARSAAEACAAHGRPARACHLHPVASNVLVDADGAVLLIDWDEAGDADPWWDDAALLQECCSFDDEWRAGAAEAVGRDDDAAIAALRLYGAADDVVWGLWAAVLSATSPRREIEYFKYASWRFMRARRSFADPRALAWIETAAGA